MYGGQSHNNQNPRYDQYGNSIPTETEGESGQTRSSGGSRTTNGQSSIGSSEFLHAIVSRYPKLDVSPSTLAHIAMAIYGAGISFYMTTFRYVSFEIESNTRSNLIFIMWFSLSQLFGALVFGNILDVYGLRRGSQLSFICGSILQAITAISTSKLHFYITLLPAFLYQGIVLGLSLASRSEEAGKRTSALGRVHMTLGLSIVAAAMLSPLVLNVLSPRGLLLFSAAGQLIGVFISSSIHDHECFADPEPALPQPAVSMLFNAFNISFAAGRVLLPQLTLLGLSLMPFFFIKFFISSFIIDVFELRPVQVSLLVVYMGLITILTQGIAIPWLSHRYDDITLINYGLYISCAGYVLLALSSAFLTPTLIFIAVPVVGGSLTYVPLLSIISKKFNNKIGTPMAYAYATLAFITLFSPLVFLLIIAVFNLPSFWIFCAIIVAANAAYLLSYSINEYAAFVSDVVTDQYTDYPTGHESRSR